MEKVLIPGLLLFIVNAICAARGCAVGYYKNGTACVHCSKIPSPDTFIPACDGACQRGFHGKFCSDQCSRNCKWSSCGRWTGKCAYGCIHNRYGDQCNISCSHGCIENKCDQLGACVNGCRSGFYGSLCFECPKNCDYCDPKFGCQKCISGHYGKTCQIPCLKCTGNKCDINGTCTYGCEVSWFGVKCDKECPPNCASGQCTDGVCDGCKPGYRGFHCNMTCPQNCTTCSQFKHVCTACKIGSYGLLCDKLCDNCTKRLCDNDGHCTDSCIQNHYGSKCENVCSKYCKGVEDDLTACSEKTGRCTNGCTDGWYGGVCDKRCSMTCLDARCVDGPSGGLICTNGCERGLWGPDCLFGCPAKCITCHNTTGICDDCANGTYGYNCSQICSDSCVGQDCDMTGNCRRGCVHGWMGEKCQYSSLWPISLTALAAMQIACIIILMRKRISKLSKPKTQYESQSTKGTQSTATLDLRDTRTAVGPQSISSHICMNASKDLPLLQASTSRDIQSAVVTRVLREHFSGYVKKQLLTGGLIKQFHRLPVNPVYPCHEGDLSGSVIKNRYGNILPYDYNRVILDGDSSNYINASYVKGYAQSCFIATQGPFNEVIGEFWTMIWQEDVTSIVMLTNCIEKCKVMSDQYWPNRGQTHMITPDLEIECLDESVYEHFTTRTFYLEKEDSESRVVKQFHFTKWPDREIPENVTSLLYLHEAVTSSNPSRAGHVVVHCSAGVGRTGTYIAIDYLMQQVEVEGAVDVFECVLRLRHQRMNLVQTEEQYLLIHNVLMQAIDYLKDSDDHAEPSVSIDLDAEESTV